MITVYSLVLGIWDDSGPLPQNRHLAFADLIDWVCANAGDRAPIGVVVDV